MRSELSDKQFDLLYAISPQTRTWLESNIKYVALGRKSQPRTMGIRPAYLDFRNSQWRSCSLEQPMLEGGGGGMELMGGAQGGFGLSDPLATQKHIPSLLSSSVTTQVNNLRLSPIHFISQYHFPIFHMYPCILSHSFNKSPLMCFHHFYTNIHNGHHFRTVWLPCQQPKSWKSQVFTSISFLSSGMVTSRGTLTVSDIHPHCNFYCIYILTIQPFIPLFHSIITIIHY